MLSSRGSVRGTMPVVTAEEGNDVEKISPAVTARIQGISI